MRSVLDSGSSAVVLLPYSGGRGGRGCGAGYQAQSTRRVAVWCWAAPTSSLPSASRL